MAEISMKKITPTKVSIKWQVWRSFEGKTYSPIGIFVGETAEEAIGRAVEHEIEHYPIGQVSGMYFACPSDMLIRRDWAVSYEKRDVSAARTSGI